MSPDPRRNAFRPDLADERLRGSVEAARFVRGTERCIVSTVASLHRQPSPDSGVDTQALFGEPVLVFEEADGWAWVQLSGDGYVGYIRATDLGPVRAQPTHRVCALRTFIYPEPNLKRPTGAYLSMGSFVRVDSIEGEYAGLAGGGFVYSRHLMEKDSHQPDFAAVAERFLETPYLWGGKSSLGIDCSGLVQLSLRETGVACPRDSNMQEAELGMEISTGPGLSGLRRGDFIFWKGHVAIMLNDRTMIHANGWSMTVLREPLQVAEERIRESTGGGITRIRRL